MSVLGAHCCRSVWSGWPVGAMAAMVSSRRSGARAEANQVSTGSRRVSSLMIIAGMVDTVGQRIFLGTGTGTKRCRDPLLCGTGARGLSS